MSTNRFYVYVIFRPDGTPCYVGRGTKDRWKSHFRKCTNKHLRSIIIAAGGELPVAIVRDGISFDESVRTEIAFIQAIGRTETGGPLVNFTDGGEGALGRKISEETRALMRRASLGRKMSDATKAAIQAANKGRKASDECRARISDALKGAPKSAEARMAMSVAASRKRLTAEHRRKIGEAGRGRKPSLETIEKISAAHKGRTFSQETIQKMKDAGAARALAVSERMKAEWAKRKMEGYVSPKQPNRKRRGPHSEQTREKMRLAHLAKHAAEYRFIPD